MKIIDKNGRLFGKISILDIFIVAILIFLAFSILFINNNVGNSEVTVNKKDGNYIVDMKAYSVYKTEDNPFKKGDILYSDEGEVIGEILETPEPVPTVSKFRLNNGTYINVDSVEYVDYFLSVKCKAAETDKGVFAAGKIPLIPSYNNVVSCRTFNGNAVVLNVEKID